METKTTHTPGPVREMPKIMTKGGDWRYFYTHADNPQRQWRVREEFSMYGGRCFSYSDVAECSSMEDAADKMLELYAIAKAEGR